MRRAPGAVGGTRSGGGTPSPLGAAGICEECGAARRTADRNVCWSCWWKSLSGAPEMSPSSGRPPGGGAGGDALDFLTGTQQARRNMDQAAGEAPLGHRSSEPALLQRSRSGASGLVLGRSPALPTAGSLVRRAGVTLISGSPSRLPVVIPRPTSMPALPLPSLGEQEPLVASPPPIRACSTGASPLAAGDGPCLARRAPSSKLPIAEVAELPGGYVASDRVRLHLSNRSFTWAPMFRRLGLTDGDQGTVVGPGVVPGTLLVHFDRSTSRPVGIDPDQLSLAREQLCLGQIRGRLSAALASRTRSA